jgi:hypothetical protein
MAKGKLTKRKTKKVRIKTPKASKVEAIHEEDDEDSVCRCICGDNDFTAKRPWIQSTACDVWQHNDCMDVSCFDDELDDHYWCEECDPDTHTALITAAVTGERPWKLRCEQRLQIKAKFEETINVVLEQVGWLWELYEPQPSAVAGGDDAVPPKRAAPAHYLAAVKTAMEVLFQDLPMRSLRDLARQLDVSSSGRHGVMRMLRKKAAAEYDESDARLLGILSELFEWREKGKLYSHESAGATLTLWHSQIKSSTIV